MGQINRNTLLGQEIQIWYSEAEGMHVWFKLWQVSGYYMILYLFAPGLQATPSLVCWTMWFCGSYQFCCCRIWGVLFHLCGFSPLIFLGGNPRNLSHKPSAEESLYSQEGGWKALSGTNLEQRPRTRLGFWRHLKAPLETRSMQMKLPMHQGESP